MHALPVLPPSCAEVCCTEHLSLLGRVSKIHWPLPPCRHCLLVPSACTRPLSPHRVGFYTSVACCTPQLSPLFLLNSASVLHTDEYVLHLVLDASSTLRKLRHCGARYPSRLFLPHSRRALGVSCALVVLTSLTITNYLFHMFIFCHHYAKLLLLQLLVSAGASAVILWCL